MRVFKLFMMMLCVGVLLVWAPLTAKADEWDMKTTMTFNKPVQVPGMVLGPGTYVFKLADSPMDRNVVQIFNANETHLYEDVLALPAYRLEPSDKTVVTFRERAEGTPEAISTWFYPGSDSGIEFIYPEASSTAVASTSSKVSAPAKTADVTPPEVRSKPAAAPETTTTVPKAQPVTTPATTHEPVQVAQTTPTPNPTSSVPAAKPAKAKQLPKTASGLPALMMLGLLSLGIAGGMHVYSRQSA